jgi:hypothetical protein
MNARLKKHLKAINLWEGETVHGARSGCAITLHLLGIGDTGIADHVGWKSPAMVHHYTLSAKVLAPSMAAEALSQASLPGPSSPAPLETISDRYQQAAVLPCLTPAFPHTSPF